MGIFDPKVDTEVTYQTPTQAPSFGPGTDGPSVGLAVAEVGAGILESFGRAAGSGGGGSRAEAAALTEFQNNIKKAESARANEKFTRAENIEREAVLKLQRRGVSINKNVTSAYSAITGRPGDELFFSREQLLEQSLMETPEYESALVATYATGEEMTMQERQAAALVG